MWLECRATVWAPERRHVKRSLPRDRGFLSGRLFATGSPLIGYLRVDRETFNGDGGDKTSPPRAAKWSLAPSGTHGKAGVAWTVKIPTPLVIFTRPWRFKRDTSR